MWAHRFPFLCGRYALPYANLRSVFLALFRPSRQILTAEAALEDVREGISSRDPFPGLVVILVASPSRACSLLPDFIGQIERLRWDDGFMVPFDVELVAFTEVLQPSFRYRVDRVRLPQKDVDFVFLVLDDPNDGAEPPN